MDISYVNNLTSGLNSNAALMFSSIIAGIVAIIGAAIGGCITGRYMMKQSEKNFKDNLRTISIEERKLEKAVLQALETEIRVNWERYTENIKPLVGKLRELSSNNESRFTDFQNIHEDKRYLYNLLSYKISVSQDYFTIYNGNSSFIGKIRNESMRKEIVSAYTNTKGMIDKILLFGLFQDNLGNSVNEIKYPNSSNARFVSDEEQIVKKLKNLMKELSDYILQVNNEQDKLDIQVNKLLPLLEAEIKSLSKQNC